jgi:AcrR family transcriptional regulator
MASMKETIQSVAVGLFYRQGYFATSISDIAKGCGIQKASIYYHYPSKEDLLFFIMESTMDGLVEHLKAVLAGAEGVEGKMRAAVHGHVQFHLEQQKETFVANSELRGLSPDHYHTVVKKRDDYEGIFQDLIKEGRDQGVFDQGDLKILSYAILTLCTAGAFWFNPEGRLAVDDIAEIYENFVLKGMKRPVKPV